MEQFLQVAVVQFELRGDLSLEAHLGRMESLVSAAASDGAELVVFPEFSSMGLLAAVTDHEVTGAMVSRDYWDFLAPLFTRIVEGIARLSSIYQVTILGGTHNRLADDGTLRNTAVLTHPDGRIEYQDKIHLTPPEHQMGASGGEHLLVTQIGPFATGILICADVQFPELARHLVGRGVELILCPSLTWNRRGAFRVRTGSSARAIENQVFVVTSPLVGTSGLPSDAPMYGTGKAMIAAPVDKTFGLNDGLLAVVVDEGERVLHAQLDRTRLLASRDRPEAPGIKLQRPELYKRLLMEEDR